MRQAHARRFFLVAFGSLFIAAATLLGAAQSPRPAPAGAPHVLIAEYDGIIHPIAAEFVDGVMARADGGGARLVVLLLRTPGGLLDSTRAMVSRMIAAKTPIVIFIAPSGSRAASAGFLLTLAADVAAMAPGTHIGAAHPVSATGGEPGSDASSARKATEDTAAYARTLAQARGRNAALAADAVTASRAFTEREARDARPPLIDLIANDVDDLLRQLNGRRITRFDGAAVTLDTSDLARETVAMSRRQQFLGAIAHPQIAYLLLSLGSLGLIVELWSPGAILPGVVGGLCLLLAFFAFQIVPVNVAGLLLIVFGLALLMLELKVPSFGALGVGGTIALFIGSVMITREVADVQVSYRFIVPVVLAIAGVFLALGRLAVQSQRLVSTTGAAGLIGAAALALTDIRPDHPGQIRVHGEIWRAVSDIPLVAGSRLLVTAVAGLTVHVQPSPGGGPKES